LLPISFLLKVMIITSSGALSPGPLTISIMRKGLDEGGRAGFLASLGHMAVEFPLVVLIGVGIAVFLTNDLAIFIIGIFGGLFILAFGALILRDALHRTCISNTNCSRGEIFKSSFIVGFNLSAFNPFFIVWWIGVGAPLAIEAHAYGGYLGIIIMYLAHVWIDFAWLIAITQLAKSGKKFMEGIGYRIFLLLLGLALLYFGFMMLLSVV